MLRARLGSLTAFVVVAAFFAALASPSLVSAQTVGATPGQTNDRIKELSAAAAKTGSHEYIIGNGDLLDVEVFDVKELSREVRVGQTGTIGIPLVPVRLHVSGLTEIQAEQKIAEVLEANGLVSNPAVSVFVKEHKSKPITIVGAIGHPMVYQADRQVTLLELLAEAGGITSDAGDTVIITRPVAAKFVEVSEPPAIGPEDPPAGSDPAASITVPSASTAALVKAPSDEPPALPTPSPAPVSLNAAAPSAAPSPASAPSVSSAAGKFPHVATPVIEGNTITINLNDLVETGDNTNNIPLQAGDIVTVPHAGIVYVIGAVGKPGGYVLSNDRTEVSTLKILALAGGTTATAKSDHAIIIRKNDQGQQSDIDVDLKKVLKRETEDVQLLPSDILYVPDSKAKAALLRAAEFGVLLGSGIALYRLAYH
jgi:protein involved in polysaccharide export with SLBB domain